MPSWHREKGKCKNILQWISKQSILHWCVACLFPYLLSKDKTFPEFCVAVIDVLLKESIYSTFGTNGIQKTVKFQLAANNVFTLFSQTEYSRNA